MDGRTRKAERVARYLPRVQLDTNYSHFEYFCPKNLDTNILLNYYRGQLNRCIMTISLAGVCQKRLEKPIHVARFSKPLRQQHDYS